MSGYRENEFSKEHDQQINEAKELLKKLRKYPEFEPFENMVFSYSSVSGSCALKLVAAYMPNSLISIATSVKHEDLLSYINRHMDEVGDGRNARQRIAAITQVFHFVHNRIDFLDPVFGSFLASINDTHNFDLDNLPLPSPAIKEKFCSPLSPALMQYIWDDLFHGLPDPRSLLSDQEFLDMSEGGPDAAKNRKIIVQGFFPSVLGRFYDAFLCSFVERYFDFGGCEDANSVCLDEEAFFNAVVEGLKAVENLQWKKVAKERTEWMSSNDGDSEKFVPRWGGSVFDCGFCGAEGMQWTEVSPKKWMPYDLMNKEVHHCPNKNVDKLTRDQVLEHLQNIGFEAYIPRTSSWKYAFIASNQYQTVYFLVGKRGIDFKLYNSVREKKLDEKGRLFTDGGEMVRNYYRDSDVNIHELILEIASRLITNTPIDESFTFGNGKSWQEQKAEYIRNLPKSTEAAARDEMREIYEAISLGDGEDAYLGDGIWISSDGSLDDRGR